MISSPGIGSGIDIGSLVEQLVAIEQQPLNRLAFQEAQFGAQISAFGQVKSVLSEFQSSLSAINDIADFTVLQATSSDETVLTASASSLASNGVFNLTVNRIAETHRLGAQNAFANIDTAAVGTAGDQLTLDVGGDSFTVDYGGLTLGEIRDAINSAADNSGVTASILKDDVGYRLLLNSDETGSDNFVTLTYNNGDPFNLTDLNNDRDGDLTFTSADLDAEIEVDGQFTSTQTRNDVSNLIQGVTLTLNEPGTTLVKIEDDNGAVQSAVEEFVDAYNTALKTVRELRTTTLADDNVTLYAIENQLRGVLNSVSKGGGTYNSVYQIGISSTFVFGSESTSNGQLEVNSGDLLDALRSDSESVAALFAEAGNGIIPRLESLVDLFTRADGLIDSKTNSLSRRIDDLGDRRESMELRIGIFEKRLLDQFNSLDTLVSQLSLTGNFLSQQLSALQPIQSK